MPFSYRQLHLRKEYDSCLIQQSADNYIPKTQKRASVSASKRWCSTRFSRGSVTVEAALVVPIFFLALVCLIYIAEITMIQTSVRAAAHNVSKKASQEVAFVPVLLPQKIEQEMIQSIGAERLNRSIIVRGSKGIHCYKSWVDPVTAVVEIVIDYEIKLPFPQFGIPNMKFQERMKVKGWTGFVKDTLSNGEGVVVYVTETGTVYHKKYECTHLDLSIQMVTGDKVKHLRNGSQGKYKPCEKCTHSGSTVGMVYITDTGDRYHGTLSCSGLKRKIYTVLLSEIKGKRACSRCGI